MKNFSEIRPRLGISGCLLGQKVRFDGGHKQDAFLCETFGRFVEWVSVCPELEVGMGVPRESVRLVGAASDPKMIAERSGRDWTMAMKRFAAIRTKELADLSLSGYVFKKIPRAAASSVCAFTMPKTCRTVGAVDCSPLRS